MDTTIANNVDESVLVQGTSWNSKVWGLLLVVSGALFLDGIDLSMVNIALPSMGAELGMGTSALQWIVNAYILGYGGFLLLGGRVSDLIGRRQVFLWAMGIFAVASIVSAFMTNDVALIALRFLKGVAAGFTVPSAMSIVATTFAKGPARSKALTIYSIFGSLGFASGLVLGGFFTQFGWRATLFAPGPATLILFILGIFLIPKTRRENVSFSQFDLWGALTMTGGLLLLVYGLVEAPEYGWVSLPTMTLLVSSIVLILAFVFIEQRHKHPLVRLGILRSASLVHASVVAALILGSFMAFQFLITLYLQDSQGWTPFAVAMAFLPSSLPIALFASAIGNYFHHRSPVIPIMIGMTLASIGYLLLLRLEPAQSYWTGLFPTMLLVGIGFAFTLPAIYVESVQGIEETEQGLASGVLNTSFQIGGAISLAVIAALLSAPKATVVTGALLPNMMTANVVISAIALLGALFTIPRLMRGKRE